MRRIVLASALSLAALPAFAADLPARTAPVAPAPVAAPAYNWSGFYVGANAGYAWGSSDVQVYGNAASALSAAGLATKYSPDVDGGSFGVQAGYNYQINQFVLGVEGDIDGLWTNGSRNFSGRLAGVGTPDLAAKVETENNWLATLRARAGFAANNFLIYGTGGFAFGGTKVTGTASVTPTGELSPVTSYYSASKSDTRTGYALGAGVEYGFTKNITARVEYMYYDLGSKTFYSDAGGSTAKADFSGNVVRAGVNYKF